MSPKLKVILTVFLPILLIFAWWLRIQLVVSGSQMIGFGVTGYDPRDLLAGHYLTYRVQYVPNDPCSSNYGEDYDICLCFGGEANETTWDGKCTKRPRTGCDRFLRGRCEGSRFIAGIERFYIPEAYASTRAIPENSVILVALDGNGGGIVSSFLVDNIPVVEWLKQNFNAPVATQN